MNLPAKNCAGRVIKTLPRTHEGSAENFNQHWIKNDLRRENQQVNFKTQALTFNNFNHENTFPFYSSGNNIFNAGNAKFVCPNVMGINR